MRISGSNAGQTVFRYSARLLATHSIRIFPLHFPSRASPCAIRFWTCYKWLLTVRWAYHLCLPGRMVCYVFFYPDDGGSRFLQNVSNHLPCYKASHTKIQQSSLIKRVCTLQLKYSHKNMLVAPFDGISSFFIITLSLWLIYYPFNFTYEANTFSICKDTSSLIETQNNTTLSNVREVRRYVHVTVFAQSISFLIVQKYFSGKSTVTINFGYTVADLQHLYFLGF